MESKQKRTTAFPESREKGGDFVVGRIDQNIVETAPKDQKTSQSGKDSMLEVHTIIGTFRFPDGLPQRLPERDICKEIHILCLEEIEYSETAGFLEKMMEIGVSIASWPDGTVALIPSIHKQTYIGIIAMYGINRLQLDLIYGEVSEENNA
jgi:hypothetical protein